MRVLLGITKTDVLHCLQSFSGKSTHEFSPYLLHLLRQEKSGRIERYDLEFPEQVEAPRVPDYFGAKLVLEEGVYSLESRSISILRSLQRYLGVTLPILKRKKNGKCKLTPAGDLLTGACTELREREEGVCYFFSVMGDPSLGSYGQISEKLIELKRRVYQRHILGKGNGHGVVFISEDEGTNGNSETNGLIWESDEKEEDDEVDGEQDGLDSILWRSPQASAKHVESQSLPLIIDEFDYLTKMETDKEIADEGGDGEDGGKPAWYCEPLKINLKASTLVRSYQKRAVSSLFWDGKVCL